MSKEITANVSGNQKRSMSASMSRNTLNLTGEVPGNLEIHTYIPGPSDIKTDETLKMENGVLSVNTTDAVEKDSALPITSAGVYTTVGNIEALLNTI